MRDGAGSGSAEQTASMSANATSADAAETITSLKALLAQTSREVQLKNELIALRDHELTLSKELIAAKDLALGAKERIITSKDRALQRKEHIISERSLLIQNTHCPHSKPKQSEALVCDRDELVNLLFELTGTKDWIWIASISRRMRGLYLSFCRKKARLQGATFSYTTGWRSAVITAARLNMAFQSGKAGQYQRLALAPETPDWARVYYRQWLKRYGFWDPTEAKS